MKVVFDTNIYISGIFWKGTPRDLLRHAISGDIDLIVSKDILEEIKTVLWRDFEMQPRDIKDILENIVQISEVVHVKSNLDVTCDRGDNKVLACALDGRADFLVSGDRHLLDLGKYKGVQVIKAARMLKMIG